MAKGKEELIQEIIGVSVDVVLEAKIKQWKLQYGEVHQVDVPLDDEGTIGVAYFRKPDLNMISAASKFIKSDPIKSSTILFNSCWLEGDSIIKDNDEAKMSACQQIGSIFKVRTATIKKL